MSIGKTTLKIEKIIRQSLRHMARKDQTYSQLVEERIKCDASDCDAVGSNEIKVAIGKLGTVNLFVCPKCIGKFQ